MVVWERAIERWWWVVMMAIFGGVDYYCCMVMVVVKVGRFVSFRFISFDFSVYWTWSKKWKSPFSCSNSCCDGGEMGKKQDQA